MDSNLKTQKPLSVLLDEIEERAKTAHFSYSSSGSGLKLRNVARTDVPALVKALRRAIYELEKEIGHPLKDLVIGDEIAALLNQGRTTQDKNLGKL